MPSRINHVKIVTPQPALVDAFLREVCDIPEGWPLGEGERLAPGTPLGPGGELTTDSMAALAPTGMSGFIAGDPSSRQFQILEGTASACWAIAISTRHVEEVHERAVARGVPCTPIGVLENWSGGGEDPLLLLPGLGAHLRVAARRAPDAGLNHDSALGGDIAPPVPRRAL